MCTLCEYVLFVHQVKSQNSTPPDTPTSHKSGCSSFYLSSLRAKTADKGGSVGGLCSSPASGASTPLHLSVSRPESWVLVMQRRRKEAKEQEQERERLQRRKQMTNAGRLRESRRLVRLSSRGFCQSFASRSLKQTLKKHKAAMIIQV